MVKHVHRKRSGALDGRKRLQNHVHTHDVKTKDKLQAKKYYSRESDFIHNTVPYRSVPYRSVPYRTVAYRTVPYRFPLQFLSRSRSLSARRTVFYA
jgi:hypothetical protein